LAIGTVGTTGLVGIRPSLMLRMFNVAE
jgi:hypothetical protein